MDLQLCFVGLRKGIGVVVVIVTPSRGLEALFSVLNLSYPMQCALSQGVAGGLSVQSGPLHPEHILRMSTGHP